MKSWAFNPDGTVRVDMPQKLIDNLTLFRDQRASLEVFKVAMFITDSTIRDEVAKDLEEILNQSGSRRIDALNNLMMTIESSGASRPQIYQSLRFLTNESGYKNNPFLLIAFARTSIYQSDSPTIGSHDVSQSSVASAVKASNESLYNITAKSALTKISKSEAAIINYWASDLYDKSNAEEKAVHHKWIRRYLEMSEEERNSYREGQVIEIVPPGAEVMTAPSAGARRLDALDEQRERRREMENQINQIGNPIPPTDPRFNEYLYKPGDRLEMKDALVQQKQRQMANGGKRPKFKVVTLSEPVHRLGARADTPGAVVYLLTEVFRYLGTHRRIMEIAEYADKRKRLVNQIEREKRRIVPPRPEKIKQAIMDVKKYGRISADSYIRQNIPPALRELEMILEESNAYYR